MVNIALRDSMTTAISVQDLVVSDRTRARLADSVPANTRRAYTRQWEQWEQWCASTGRTPLPATAESLAEYVTMLADDNLSPSTIEQAMAAIRTAHRAAGYAGQPDTTAAQMILRTARRERSASGRGARQAPPITVDILRRMIEICDPGTASGLRDRVLLVVGFALMGRRSEIAALSLDDVVETEDGLLITIRQSKTDQDAAGRTVAIPPGQHADTDPVRLVRAWRRLLSEHDITEGPLLRRVDQHQFIHDAGLSGTAVNEAVRRLAIRADLPNADRYTAHSLRSGAATAAYRAGAPVSTIARHGRWSPSSPVVLGYIRAVDQWTDNAMTGVGL